MNGILYEIDPSIRYSEQRSAICAANDVDGGSLVVLGAPVTGDTDCFAATAPATATASGVYVAYNPSFWYTTDGTIVYPAVNVDRRTHTNLKTKAFGAFKPKVGQIFGVTAEDITGSTAPTVGKYLEPTESTFKYTIKSAQTENSASFKVIEIRQQHFPDGSIGGTYVPVYVVETMFN